MPVNSKTLLALVQTNRELTDIVGTYMITNKTPGYANISSVRSEEVTDEYYDAVQQVLEYSIDNEFSSPQEALDSIENAMKTFTGGRFEECWKKKFDAVRKSIGFEPSAGVSLGTDLDQSQESFNIRNEFIKQVELEQKHLNIIKEDIRKRAMSIQNDLDRFQYLISNSQDERQMVREASKQLLFEFIANRNVDPCLITTLANQSENLLRKLYDFRESDFIIKFKKMNGV